MMKKRIHFLLLILFCLWGTSLTGAGVIPIPDLINPDEIKMDDTQIYFIDGVNIHIYSLKDVSFKKKFGKAGEGPREFLKHPQTALTVDVSASDIAVTGMTRVSFFTKNGMFKKALKTPWQNGGFLPFGDKFVGWRRVQEENATYSSLNILDAGLKNPKELSRWKTPSIQGEIHLLKAPRIIRVQGNRLFVAVKTDFIIDVFDKKGTKIYSIDHEYKKLEVTDADKDGVMDYFRKDPRFRAIFERFKRRLRFPDYFPAIRNFFADKGKLYVRTYKKLQDKSEFLIMDQEGKPLKTVFLPISEKDGKESYPYIIKNDTVYQLIENTDEEWELHIHPVHR
jgi:hypothetical protein